jgi:uncharacterized protein
MSALYHLGDMIALDGPAKSVRTYDQDGHLHVSDAPISKASVNGYYGHEIPNAQELGLDPNRMYQLLRDPVELSKAAESFEGKPLMLIHRGVTSNDHARSLVVGSIGSPAKWDGTYVRAPLHIWDGEAIEGIEDNSQRQISSGYRYKAVMTPGRFNGQPFDGRMVGIAGNHAAFVTEGRVGPDVAVGDAVPSVADFIFATRNKEPYMANPAPSRTAQLASFALRGFLAGKLATDQKVNLTEIVKGVTAKTWPADKGRVIANVIRATTGKMAMDAGYEDLPQVMDSIDAPAAEEAKAPPAPAPKAPPFKGAAPPLKAPPNGGAPPPAGEDPEDDDGVVEDANEAKKARLHTLLGDKIDPETMAAVLACLDDEGSEEGMDEEVVMQPGKPTPITKAGMDAAISRAVKKAEAATITRLNAIAEAQRLVRPAVGDLALDGAPNAAHVFKLALDHMEVDTAGMPPEAYRATFTAIHKAREEAADHVRNTMPANGNGGGGSGFGAFDSAAATETAKRFPNMKIARV